jgi:hypothetical protein
MKKLMICLHFKVNSKIAVLIKENWLLLTQPRDKICDSADTISPVIQYCDVMPNYGRSELLPRHNTAPRASIPCPLSAEIEPSEGGLGSLVMLRRHNWWQMLRSVNGQRSLCVVESSVIGIWETDFMFSWFLYRFPNTINICATSLGKRCTVLSKVTYAGQHGVTQSRKHKYSK